MIDEARNAATQDSETRVASAEADVAARVAHSNAAVHDDHLDVAARDDHSNTARVDHAHAPSRSRDEIEPRAGGRYRVEELFAFHDRAFVENAFRAALGRAPEAAEMEATLSDLRAARRDKRQIVEDLVFSAEGAARGARVEGVSDSRLKRRVRGLPIVGYLWQLLSGLARLPRLMRHQREFEAYAHAQHQLIADRLNEQERRGQEFIAEQFRTGLQRFDADLVASIDDAREAVFMLSDALATLSTLHAQSVERREQIEAQLAARLDTHQQGIEELQHALNAQQRALEVQTRALDEPQRQRLDDQQRRLDAQEEFLIQEQRAIVEAQKAALAEIEERLREAEASARRALDALAPDSPARADATDATRVAREA
jgi:putative N-acetylmannosamine-6-phosphate epimerase